LWIASLELTFIVFMKVDSIFLSTTKILLNGQPSSNKCYVCNFTFIRYPLGSHPYLSKVFQNLI